MSTPHKHSALIHAWADGAVIERCVIGAVSGTEYWMNSKNPDWAGEERLRIKPHRWQKEIDAQAAGKVIQIRCAGPWFDDSVPNFGNTSVEFRIKPEMLRYRIALMRAPNGGQYTVTADDEAEFEIADGLSGFVKWLGDWQEVEA